MSSVWIEVVEFVASVGSFHSPCRGTGFLITSCLPRLDFRGHCGDARKAAVQTLTSQNAQFHFRHVQPTSIHWGVNDSQATCQSMSGRSIERMIQTGDVVGVQIVANEGDNLCMRIVDFKQCPNLFSPVLTCSTFTSTHAPPATQRVKEHEQRPHSFAFVMMVLFAWLPRSHRQGRIDITGHLLCRFVHTNQRMLVVIVLAVNI